MEYGKIVEILAPCGLDCSRCVRFAGGKVANLSTSLGAALTGFDRMAAMAADRVPAFKDYKAFLEVLKVFKQADCKGCRAGGCQAPFCSAGNCFREKGVDFCFQCDEYPCSRNNYPASLDSRWHSFNDRMKEVGVEKFYEEQKEKPRY